MLVDIQKYLHRFFQLLIDHTIDKKLEGLQGAAMLSDKNPIPVALQIKVKVPFPHKSHYLSLQHHAFQQSNHEFLCNLNSSFFHDLNLTPFCSCNIDERSIRH